MSTRVADRLVATYEGGLVSEMICAYLAKRQLLLGSTSGDGYHGHRRRRRLELGLSGGRRRRCNEQASPHVLTRGNIFGGSGRDADASFTTTQAYSRQNWKLKNYFPAKTYTYRNS